MGGRCERRSAQDVPDLDPRPRPTLTDIWRPRTSDMGGLCAACDSGLGRDVIFAVGQTAL